jgi:DNA-binding beta-propeller fold protein YncE
MGLAVTPDGKTVYAVDSLTVVPISTATGKAGKPIQTGYNSWQMVFTPNGKTGYVLGGLNTVTPVSTVTGKAGKPITVGRAGYSAPWAIAITPNGKTAWVTGDQPHNVLHPPGYVLPISTATNKPGRLLQLGQGDRCLVTTPWRAGPVQGPSACD